MLGHTFSHGPKEQSHSVSKYLWDMYKRNHKLTNPRKASKAEANPLSLGSFKLGMGNKYLETNKQTNSIVKRKMIAVTKAFGEISLNEKKVQVIVSILDESESEFICVVVTKYFLYESLPYLLALMLQSGTETHSNFEAVCVMGEGRETW